MSNNTLDSQVQACFALQVISYYTSLLKTQCFFLTPRHTLMWSETLHPSDDIRVSLLQWMRAGGANWFPDTKRIDQLLICFDRREARASCWGSRAALFQGRET